MWYWRRIQKISWTDYMRNADITESQEGEEYPTYNKNKEGRMDWLHTA